jgi:dephospho-CoA kinase
VVDCDEETQIRRLLQRDSESIEQAQRILNSQASRQERLAIADDVIRNDQSLDQTRTQVADLDQRFRLLRDDH